MRAATSTPRRVRPSWGDTCPGHRLVLLGRPRVGRSGLERRIPPGPRGPRPRGRRLGSTHRRDGPHPGKGRGRVRRRAAARRAVPPHRPHPGHRACGELLRRPAGDRDGDGVELAAVPGRAAVPGSPAEQRRLQLVPVQRPSSPGAPDAGRVQGFEGVFKTPVHRRAARAFSDRLPGFPFRSLLRSCRIVVHARRTGEGDSPANQDARFRAPGDGSRTRSPGWPRTGTPTGPRSCGRGAARRRWRRGSAARGTRPRRLR